MKARKIVKRFWSLDPDDFWYVIFFGTFLDRYDFVLTEVLVIINKKIDCRTVNEQMYDGDIIYPNINYSGHHNYFHKTHLLDG